MWQALSKPDLIIEVWEKLDCESVGAAEIAAIMTAVEGAYGAAAVDSPMVIARQLADEGAVLRHAEIMELYLKWSAQHTDPGYDLPSRPDLFSLAGILQFIRKLEAQRRRAGADKTELRAVRELALKAKNELNDTILRSADDLKAATAREAYNWITIWLQTPAIFETWVAARQKSQEFREKFNCIVEENEYNP